MTEEQPPNANTDDQDSSVSDSAIADSFRAMISTTLDIGASMAKMVAEATSGGRAVALSPKPGPGQYHCSLQCGERGQCRQHRCQQRQPGTAIEDRPNIHPTAQ